MTVDKRLQQLARLSAMKRDADLGQLQAAQHACDTVRARLDALRAAPSDGADLPLQRLAEIALRYENWADARRKALNSELARRLAEHLQAQDQARKSFGRALALDRLVDRSVRP